MSEGGGTIATSVGRAGRRRGKLYKLLYAYIIIFLCVICVAFKRPRRDGVCGDHHTPR